jgi:hypothetical protein
MHVQCSGGVQKQRPAKEELLTELHAWERQLVLRSLDEAIRLIESDKVDLFAQTHARRGKYFLEHARVKKECRTQIEFEPVRLNGRRSPTEGRTPLDHFDLQPGTGEQDG